ncbi:hypothetical protein TRFO_13666 [Tritrichomonas foetus]|uniref:MYCBP-associated protein n=1 Tax=Tritrichomonas foetus TaxID=1144522 RepID=A0A1J4KX64_9EUKA|nr:hypothetical protein TRFO_13666 [Tritrichomonas foetus]|eukprot:OHT15849.1 hypothetical protein TRFO_13666 [Tritrichomonas foetus]
MHQKDKNRERRLQDFKPLESTRLERAMKYHLEVQKRWEAQGKALAERTGRDPSTLSMFSDDQFRHVNEERELISQVVFAIASKDMGVWKPLARIGDIYAQRERPRTDPLELIRNPDEKDNVNGSRPTNFFHSKYYKKRVKQLRSFIEKLKPFEPDYEGLVVIGKPVELEQFKELPQVEDQPEEIIKQSGREEEELHESIVKIKLNCNRLFFTTTPGATQAKSIEVTNCGTTAVYYNWSVAKDIDLMIGEKGNRAPIKKQPEPNMPDITDQFDWRASDSFVVAKDVQKKTRSEFCFTQLSGSILPGNTATFSFSFKSDVPGCFLQRWSLRTTPSTQPHASYSVNLRGCCQIHPPDLSSFKRSIDNSLHESERNRCLEEIMSAVFERVSKIVKLRSQQSEERIEGDVLVDDRAPVFEEANKEWNLTYSPGLFASLQSIAEECWDALEITGFDRFWDMRVLSISEMAMKIEDGVRKREILLKLNEIIQRHATSNTTTNLTYSLAFVQLSTMTEGIPDILERDAQSMNTTLPTFIVPKVPDPAELEEAQESQRRRHRGRREPKKPPPRKTLTRKGKANEDESRLNSPTENRGELSPELKQLMKDSLVKQLKLHLAAFERLAGESAGVANQLTRVNEMDQLDTNLDLEVEDDDF